MATKNITTTNIRGPRGRRTNTYRSWTEMRARCDQPNRSEYKYYGARGISYCEGWDSFDTFLADMGERPKGCTLDRIDNNQGYSKDNCRWATPMQQSQNTRQVRNITFNGETHCIREWARRIGIWENALRERIKRGWPIEKALEKAIRQ